MYTNNTENNQTQEQKTYTFCPEFAGMKDKFMPAFGLMFIGILLNFLPKFVDLTKISYSKYSLSMIEQKYFLIAGLVMAFIGFVKFLKLKIYCKTTKYTLTPQRLTIERGFFSKTISNLELWRISDIQMKQTFKQTSFGSCTLQLITSDISDPIINIDGLQKSKGKVIYQILGDYVNTALRTSGIMKTI